MLPSGLSVPTRSALQDVLERKNLMKSQADGMSRLDKLQYELKMKSVALNNQLKDLAGEPAEEEHSEEKSLK